MLPRWVLLACGLLLWALQLLAVGPGPGNFTLTARVVNVGNCDRGLRLQHLSNISGQGQRTSLNLLAGQTWNYSFTYTLQNQETIKWRLVEFHTLEPLTDWMDSIDGTISFPAQCVTNFTCAQATNSFSFKNIDPIAHVFFMYRNGVFAGEFILGGGRTYTESVVTSVCDPPLTIDIRCADCNGSSGNSSTANSDGSPGINLHPNGTGSGPASGQFASDPPVYTPETLTNGAPDSPIAFTNAPGWGGTNLATESTLKQGTAAIYDAIVKGNSVIENRLTGIGDKFDSLFDHLDENNNDVLGMLSLMTNGVSSGGGSNAVSVTLTNNVAVTVTNNLPDGWTNDLRGFYRDGTNLLTDIKGLLATNRLDTNMPVLGTSAFTNFDFAKSVMMGAGGQSVVDTVGGLQGMIVGPGDLEHPSIGNMEWTFTAGENTYTMDFNPVGSSFEVVFDIAKAIVRWVLVAFFLARFIRDLWDYLRQIALIRGQQVQNAEASVMMFGGNMVGWALAFVIPLVVMAGIAVMFAAFWSGLNIGGWIDVFNSNPFQGAPAIAMGLFSAAFPFDTFVQLFLAWVAYKVSMMVSMSVFGFVMRFIPGA